MYKADRINKKLAVILLVPLKQPNSSTCIWYLMLYGNLQFASVERNCNYGYNLQDYSTQCRTNTLPFFLP